MLLLLALGLSHEIGHFDDVVDVAAHYHEPESCDRIQVDHPLHIKGKTISMTNHTSKFHTGIERPRREIMKLSYVNQSPYFSKHKSVLNHLSSKEKIVVDYAFLNLSLIHI